MSAILYVDLIVIIFPLDWRSIPRSIEPQMSLFSLHSTRILQNASTINSSIGNTQQQQLGISIGAEGMTAYSNRCQNLRPLGRSVLSFGSYVLAQSSTDNLFYITYISIHNARIHSQMYTS